jgi:hypothetical protein
MQDQEVADAVIFNVRYTIEFVAVFVANPPDRKELDELCDGALHEVDAG